MKAKKIIAGFSAVAIAAAMAGAVPFTGANLLDTAVQASAEEQQTLSDFIAEKFCSLSPEYLKELFIDPVANRSEVAMTIDGVEADFTLEHTSTTSGTFTYENEDTQISLNVSVATDPETGDEFICIDSFSVIGTQPEEITLGGQNWSAPTSSTIVTPTGGDPFDITPAPENANATVEFNVDPAYTVTIPTLITLEEPDPVVEGYSYYAADNITAEGVRLEPQQKIVVNINSDDGNGFLLANNADNTCTLPYEVLAPDAETAELAAVADGGKVAEFETNADPVNMPIAFGVAEGTEITYAGRYTDTVVFDIAVEDAPANVPVSSITLSHDDLDLFLGYTVLVTATVGPDNATNKELEWTASGGAVSLDVSPDTLSCLVNASWSGSGTITVRAKDGSGVAETINVTVND